MQAIFVMFSVTHVMLNDELDRIRKEDVMAQLMSDPSTWRERLWTTTNNLIRDSCSPA